MYRVIADRDIEVFGWDAGRIQIESRRESVRTGDEVYLGDAEWVLLQNKITKVFRLVMPNAGDTDPRFVLERSISCS